jgi:Tol biopolymer transport system component
VQYDLGSHRFTTILPGSRADYSTYSRDGQWIAYVAIPDGVLWRVKSDGSQRSPVTSSPINPASPAWSPDAKQIAFVNRSATCDNKVYLVSAEGGTPRDLFPDECGQFDPAWSPDGKSLAFARAGTLPSGASTATTIQFLDLTTNRLSTLTGSQGMRAPSWSPDGKFIAAMSEDYHHLQLFDVGMQKWVELAQGTVLNGALRWSRDGAFLYFQDLLAPHEAVYKVQLGNHRREEVVNFEAFIQAGVPRCALDDVAPDGSLVVTLQRNNADVYSLELSRP